MAAPHWFQDVSQLCRSGHVITTSYNSFPTTRRAHCGLCGAGTLNSCGTCGQTIAGAYMEEIDIGLNGKTMFKYVSQLKTPAPTPYCEGCGSAFPWVAAHGPTDGPALSLAQLCLGFPRVVRQLRKRREKRPTLDVQDEYDAQDLFHALLRLHFEDIRPEEHTPSYAGKSARMDFLLKDEKTVVELKHTREGLRDAEVGSQLIEDVARYKEHSDCRKLVCFVYDPSNLIANPRGLEKDLSREQDGLAVQVIIAS
jgi:hypothetical protein